jgi:nitroreductase
MEEIYKIITQRRTIRRFKPKKIPLNILKKLVNCARLAPSAGNLQALEYIIVNDKKLCSEIFPYLRWAGYIHPQGIPHPEKRPTAYIVVLVNMEKANKEYFAYDVGAAVENILIFAYSLGIGSCWMKSIDKDKIAHILKVPYHIMVDSVISLGFKDESPIIEKFKNSPQYWKDERGTLHVPKRALKDILHYNYYRKR